MNTYKVKIGKLTRKLPLFEVAPGVKIALFNILGDTEVVVEAASELIKKINKEIEIIVTAEVKSVPLAYEMSRQMKVPYVVLRKVRKPYMTGSVSEEVVTITTGKKQELWLDGKDKDLVKGKKILLVDDVISTGSTLEGMRKLMKKAGAEVIEEVAVFTEGDEDKWENVISLGHLPVFEQ